MLEIAKVHSPGSNGLSAWARIASWSDRVNAGDKVMPRWAWMIPSFVPTKVIQSRDRASGETTSEGIVRPCSGCKCQEYGTSVQEIDSPNRYASTITGGSTISANSAEP